MSYIPSLCLTCFTQHDALWFHPCCCKWHYFIPCNDWVIFHDMYVPHLLYSFLCQWTFRWLPCPGYCKQCCSDHWGACILWDHGFSLDICPGVGSQGHMVALFLVFFKGVSILISIVATPIYVLTSSIGGFPSLHTLPSVYCLWVFWW